MILRYYNALRWIYITRTRCDIVSRCFWHCRRVWRQDLISTRWRSSDITKRGWMVMQQDKIIRLFATAWTALTGTASLHLVIVVSWWAHQALPRRSWQPFIMRPSSLGGGRILRRNLSVRLSVCLSVRPIIVTERHVAPPSELQWHTCTFRHALRAAYRTAISAAQACLDSGHTQSAGWVAHSRLVVSEGFCRLP